MQQQVQPVLSLPPQQLNACTLTSLAVAEIITGTPLQNYHLKVQGELKNYGLDVQGEYLNVSEFCCLQYAASQNFSGAGATVDEAQAILQLPLTIEQHSFSLTTPKSATTKTTSADISLDNTIAEIRQNISDALRQKNDYDDINTWAAIIWYPSIMDKMQEYGLRFNPEKMKFYNQNRDEKGKVEIASHLATQEQLFAALEADPEKNILADKKPLPPLAEQLETRLLTPLSKNQYAGFIMTIDGHTTVLARGKNQAYYYFNSNSGKLFKFPSPYAVKDYLLSQVFKTEIDSFQIIPFQHDEKKTRKYLENRRTKGKLADLYFPLETKKPPKDFKNWLTLQDKKYITNLEMTWGALTVVQQHTLWKKWASSSTQAKDEAKKIMCDVIQKKIKQPKDNNTHPREIYIAKLNLLNDAEVFPQDLAPTFMGQTNMALNPHQKLYLWTKWAISSKENYAKSKNTISSEVLLKYWENSRLYQFYTEQEINSFIEKIRSYEKPVTLQNPPATTQSSKKTQLATPNRSANVEIPSMNLAATGFFTYRHCVQEDNAESPTTHPPKGQVI